MNQAWALILKIAAPKLLDGFAVASVTTQAIAHAIQAGVIRSSISDNAPSVRSGTSKICS